MNENPITNATGLSAVIPKDNDGYCTVYKLDCADGLGLMTVYQVYPGILHGMARFLALYQGEYSRERLVLRLRTVHPKTITRLAQNDTGNAADCHMKQILSIYNGAGRTHNLPCKR